MPFLGPDSPQETVMSSQPGSTLAETQVISNTAYSPYLTTPHSVTRLERDFSLYRPYKTR